MNLDVTGTLARPERQVTTESWVRRRFSRPHRVAVPLLVAGATILYLAISLTRFHRFEASSYDLVIFDQAIRGYAHFQLPYAPIKAADGFGPDFSVLGDHFSPIIALLAPLYWIHDGPQTLLVAQSVLLALAIVPLWAYVRRTMGATAAYAIAGCYVIGLPAAFAAKFDFHEVAFVPLLMALMIERFDAHQRGLAPLRHTFLAVGALLLVKEDMGLAVAGFGVYLALAGKRLAGLALVVLGPVCVVVTTKLFIPAFGGNGDFYWRYGSLGADPGAVLWTMVTDPLHALHVMVTPMEKVQLLFVLGLPLLFACALSPLSLIAAPLLLERILSDHLRWVGSAFHYNAFVVIPLLCAAVDGVLRVRRWRAARRERQGERTGESTVTDQRSVTPQWALTALCLTALTALVGPVPKVFVPSFYAPTEGSDARERIVAGERIVARIPSGVTVEAASSMGPPLSSRTTVLLWTGTRRTTAEWVITDVKRHIYPIGNARKQRRITDALLRSGYRQVDAGGGYVLLRRADG